MQSTPSLKSSTSSEPNYEGMLKELLSLIHRDGGQFTTLAGLEVSFEEAKQIVFDNRFKFRPRR